MSGSVSLRRSRARGWASGLAIGALALASLSSSMADGMGSRGLWVIRGSGVSISGQSVPPPSHLLHLLPRFHALLHGYVSLNGDQKLSFASWVIANGIVDPAMVAGMVELYEWYVATFRRLP